MATLTDRLVRTEQIRDAAVRRFADVAARAGDVSTGTLRFASRRLARATRVFVDVRRERASSRPVGASGMAAPARTMEETGTSLESVMLVFTDSPIQPTLGTLFGRPTLMICRGSIRFLGLPAEGEGRPAVEPAPSASPEERFREALHALAIKDAVPVLVQVRDSADLRCRPERLWYGPIASTGPGIYALCDQAEVLYIGQSVDVAHRLRTHAQTRPFSSALVLPCPVDLLNDVEQRLIRVMSPPWNIHRYGGRRD